MQNVIEQVVKDRYAIYNGDSCEVIKDIPSDSLHYSIFSPPFSSLYTYSNSDRDMGNCEGDDSFADHFSFLVEELYRVIMPGRLVSFHCMNIPATITRDGFIGVKDFRGDLIRMFQSAGFIFHSEVCIWKDPVVAMQRTKAIGLLHKQVNKDSSISRQGIPDYLVTMRKPGANPEPISGLFKADEFAGEDAPKRSGDEVRDSINIWQRYASPVWMDIDAGRTLQVKGSKEIDEERHICPLQLDVISRALQLWTNPDDVVFTPFLGIGSEAYESVRMG
jgi:DNA methylase